MEKTDYINAINNIRMQDNDKAEIWQSISNTAKAKAPSSRKISVKRIVAVAAAAVCITVIATPVVSSGVESLLSKYRSDSQTVSEKVEVDIFEDSDGHVKITVEEMLSDVQSVYMIVSYEALDEIGEEWLADYDFNKGFYSLGTKQYFSAGLSILPDDLQSCSYGNFEIEENRTETERWFYVLCESSDGTYESRQGIFGYPMTENGNSTYLNTEGNIETHKYILQSDESPSERFVPRYLTVSDLSFTIFAENISVYEHFEKNGCYVSNMLISYEEIDEVEASTYFIMENGEKILVGFDGGMGRIEPDANNNYSDLNLLHGTHQYVNEETGNYEYRAIDSEKIVGLEIMGVYYELK